MSRLHRGRALLRQLLEQGWVQQGTQHDRGTIMAPHTSERRGSAYVVQAA
jgi:hypothetical protein